MPDGRGHFAGEISRSGSQCYASPPRGIGSLSRVQPVKGEIGPLIPDECNAGGLGRLLIGLNADAPCCNLVTISP